MYDKINLLLSLSCREGWFLPEGYRNWRCAFVATVVVEVYPERIFGSLCCKMLTAFSHLLLLLLLEAPRWEFSDMKHYTVR